MIPAHSVALNLVGKMVSRVVHYQELIFIKVGQCFELGRSQLASLPHIIKRAPIIHTNAFGGADPYIPFIVF